MPSCFRISELYGSQSGWPTRTARSISVARHETIVANEYLDRSRYQWFLFTFFAYLIFTISDDKRIGVSEYNRMFRRVNALTVYAVIEYAQRYIEVRFDKCMIPYTEHLEI